MSRFLQAEINLNALIHNFLTIKALLNFNSLNHKIIAIIKADAYGHGAVEVARVLEINNVEYLGVAFFEEAAILREAGVKSRILVLFDREVEGLFRYNLTPVVFDFKQAEALSNEASKRGKTLPVHIKVETGMGRLGIYENSCETIKKIAGLPNLKIEGVMSHLSQAEDSEWTNEQIKRFIEIKNCMNKEGFNCVFHIASSAGLFYPQALFEAVRPGIMLYGYSCQESENHLKPCMTVKTKLIDIRKIQKGTPISYGRTFITKKDSLIGVIPVGYADGYFRKLSNKAWIIVRGKKVPVVGTICMDLTMLDLTDIPDAKIDDEVILLGSSGKEKITAWDIATWAETIPYEILTSFGSRARRKYINDIKENKQ